MKWIPRPRTLGTLLALLPGNIVTGGDQPGNVRTLPVGSIEIRDTFWAPKLKVYREQTIPHSWFYMQWEQRALQKAAGRQVDGELNGTWGEANLYKFLETAAYAVAQQRDPVLERRIDEIIDLLARGQQPDGYLHAFVTNNQKTPWDPDFLDGSHDGYVLGHMIEAAIEYHAATGKRAFLDIACNAADQACRHFLGPDGHPGFCGHAELEMALVELYRVTGEPRYLELSRAFVEWRGRGRVKPFSETPRAYFQDAAPLRAQRTLDGHAVRAIFFATGVADLAIETGDTDYRLAANRFWDSTTRRRMAITGSVGPRKEHEAFGEDYELPLDGYYESCGACGLADFAQRMFQLERRADGAEVLERVLYNAVLHGIGLGGTNTYYCNPLNDRDHLRDNCWVCCPPNLSRTLFQVGRYAYARTERELFVNLFVGGTARLPFGTNEVSLHVDTEYPWNGEVNCRIESASPISFALRLRRPEWCPRAEITLNGRVLDARPDEEGYWTLERPWQDADALRLRMEMPVLRMEAHPNVTACRGKVALQRGPLVYGFEGVDNAPDVPLEIDPGATFAVQKRPDLLGGVTVVSVHAPAKRPLLAVPFFALANRGPSTQHVWVLGRDAKPSEAWWLGGLYRPRGGD